MPVPIGSSLLIACGVSGAGWAGPVLDKALERLFDGAGKRVLEDVQARLRAYTGDIPRNHDLEQAIRLVELTSTLVLLETYRRRDEGDRFDTRGAPPPPFIAAAQHWLHEQIGLSPQMTVVSNDALVAELERQLDRLLSAREPAEVRTTLKDAEGQVWDDLKVGIGQQGVGEPPSEFANLFFGNDTDEPGWSVTFLAFMREVFKKNPRAEVAFVTTRLAAVRSVLDRLETRIDALHVAVIASEEAAKRWHEESEEAADRRQREVLIKIGKPDSPQESTDEFSIHPQKGSWVFCGHGKNEPNNEFKFRFRVRFAAASPLP